MTVGFVGHAFISEEERVKARVKEELCRHAEGVGERICYLGGYGAFDELCARACRELKQERGGIELVYVAPYMSSAAQAKIREMEENGLYDTSVYPPLERVPLRLAVLRRNEWLVTRADLIIAYVEHRYGGAYRSLRMAEQRKKRILNIGNLS
ncbi:MAG: hypothetical protein IJF73_03650 [Clostridia bacterium]|nr:hypothetical protein [Clostridia bacterium]